MRIQQDNYLRGLIDELYARAKKAAASSGASTLHYNQYLSQAIIGPSQTIAFDSPTQYVPKTTGLALIMGIGFAQSSSSGDEVQWSVRQNGAGSGIQTSSFPGGTNTDHSGTPWNIVPISAGVGFTIGLQAANQTGGHTLTAQSNKMQVLIIELGVAGQ